MNYKLGKLPAIDDPRTFKLAKILNAANLPELPAVLDIDKDVLNRTIPEQMFGNDQWGCCVISGRANHTLRFEELEQDKIVPITAQDVINEYFKEGGATPSNPQPDNGLNMLKSLNEWRQSGWKVSDGNNYTIHAFAKIDVNHHVELCYAVLLLNGAYIGFEVPKSAMEQFDRYQPWTVVPNSPIEGGHCVYIVGYNTLGPICVTWGRKQQMTWEFYDRYTDEAYAIVDSLDSWVANDPINVEALEQYLKDISGSSPPVPPNPTPIPPAPSGFWANLILWIKKLFHIA